MVNIASKQLGMIQVVIKKDDEHSESSKSIGPMLSRVGKPRFRKIACIGIVCTQKNKTIKIVVATQSSNMLENVFSDC